MFSFIALFLILSPQVFSKSVNNHEMHPHFPPQTKNLKVNPDETSSKYWYDNAQTTVNDIINRKLNQNVAKNVILFLGDGMSIPTVAAARVYSGGEEVQHSFDKFPHTALSKTYAVDRQVPDSANTATAYLCGIKANYGTIGVGPEVPRYDCVGMTNEENFAHSIAYHSQKAGKKTGLVTTARVTHASPAGVYAHTADRDWESDSDILDADEDPTICKDIATQLIEEEPGKNLNVIFGGGRTRFLPKDVTDEDGKDGKRSDGKNLIDQFLTNKNSVYVTNREELLKLETPEFALGLFGHTHIDYNLDRNATLVPSLAEMTQAAITLLSRGENGYFLFVEGARIDMAHHDSEAKIALDETREFSKAVQAAVDMTNEEDTLIVVTSDHAHTMSYSGYAERGHNILEFAGEATDDKVYTILNYGNGPGYKKPDKDGGRHDITDDDYEDDHFNFPSGVPLDSETHGGDDVAIFAKGPWAHLFDGVLEENVIPHLMAYASCVGDGLTACDNKSGLQ